MPIKSSNLWSALGVALASIVFGCLLFQASAMAFDYMKLRAMPLYGSAASLGAYSDTLSRLVHEMDDNTDTIKGLIRERATIDITLAGKSAAEKDALTDGRNVLRKLLSPTQAQQSGFDKAGANFTALDGIFQQVCPAEANTAAGNVVASLEGAPSADSGVSAPSNAGARAPSTLVLSAAQTAAVQPACQIPVDYCEGGAPRPTAGARARMICAEKTLQDAQRRKDAIGSFQYDSADYITEVMKLSYPSFAKADVDNAVRVTSGYRALARKTDAPSCSTQPATSTATGSSGKPSCARPADESPSLLAPFWDFLLDIPLAILYLALGFMFGGIGSLANYLYATAAPESLARTPSEAPWFTIVAGGGAAILTLLVVMAGFQFLTIGASSPDLAYPNPLTVCGLSGIVGLGGDRVLTTLRTWLGKFFGEDARRTGAAGEKAHNDAAGAAAGDDQDANHS